MSHKHDLHDSTSWLATEKINMKVLIAYLLFAAFMLGLGVWLLVHGHKEAGGLLMIGAFLMASSISYKNDKIDL